jgi:hypothetical protein
MGLDLKILRLKADGTIYFDISDTPSYVSGIDLLVQMVAIAYLENPGQDISNPTEGSGVRTLIGQFDMVNQKDLKVEFLTRTTKIEREIIQRQTNLDIRPDEKLKKLNILSLNINSDTSELIAEVAIENQADQRIVVRV